jgi:dTDP-4-amino-4,6-dideoxygalactose transaminase
MVVHLHGLPADMDRVAEVARRHELVLIEDAAQAHGAHLDGRRVGGLGDVGAFSIMAGKNLPTAGEGGLLTTDRPELRDRAEMVKMFGERGAGDGQREYHALTLGWNYRLSSVLAAFARSQLARLDGHTATVRENAAHLSTLLADLPGLSPPVEPEGRRHVYHHYRLVSTPTRRASTCRWERFARRFRTP